jgi:hypothetical protein
MSIWTTLSGTAYISRDCKCSIRKLIEETFDETSTITVDIVSENSREQKVFIKFSFSDEGESALKICRHFISKIKEFDRSSYVDLEFSTRLTT